MNRRSIRIALVIVAVTVATQLVLLIMHRGMSDTEFVARTRDAFSWGIVLTLIYKQFIVLMMALTWGKRGLDRSFIWHTQSVAALFIYAWLSIEYPTIFLDHLVLSAWAWFNIWVDIALSAGFVVYFLWVERISPVIRICREFGWPGRKVVFTMLRGTPHDVANPR